MLFSDKPIQKNTDDKLNRVFFARKFAKAIREYDKVEPLVVGIHGAWGNGKTSVLNMILNELDVLEDNNKRIVLRFEPWNYNSVNQLIEQYFTALATAISFSKENKIHSLGKTIEEYGKSISETVSVPIIKTIAEMSSWIGKEASGRTVFGNGDLSNQRKEIINRLKDYEGQIIVTIDDIDRLAFDEIRAIFRLVASVANFPNTVFLLCFDKQIVCDALNVEQKKGEDYLEKIVQVSVELPPISMQQLRGYFSSVFEKYLMKGSKIVWQEAYWAQVSASVFAMLSNIRDVIRLANVIDIKASMIADELNFVDIVLITCIELKCYALFKWIYKNKLLLVEGPNRLIDANSLRSGVPKEEIENEIDEMRLCISTKTVLRMLSYMFPKLSELTGEYNYLYEDPNSLVRNQRIASPSKFDRYFSLVLDEVELNRNEVDIALSQLDQDELVSYISRIIECGQIESFLLEVQAFTCDLDAGRAECVACALSKCVTRLKKENKRGALLINHFRVEICLMDLLFDVREKDQDAVYRIIDCLIDESDADSIEGVAIVLQQQALAFGIIPTDQTRGYRKLLTEEQIQNLASKYIDKVFEIDKTNNMLELESDNFTLGIIKFLAPEKYKAYLEEKLKDDNNVLKYVLTQIGEGRYSNGVKTGKNYSISEELKSEKYIVFSSVDRILQDQIKNGGITRFKPEQVVKLAAFSLRNNNANDFGVTEDACINRITEWEKGLLIRDTHCE